MTPVSLSWAHLERKNVKLAKPEYLASVWQFSGQTLLDIWNERGRPVVLMFAIGASESRRMWTLPAVEAGHLRDARLTLLTCLHQHASTHSMAQRQLSHDASQNKARRSHPRSPSSMRNADLCPGRNPPFSWNQKADESRSKPSVPYFEFSG